MLQTNDVGFLQQRVSEELRFAEESTDPSAAQVHRKMAMLYASQLRDAPVIPLPMYH